MSMLLSPLFLRHGVAALQEELARLTETARRLSSHQWPADYDPNDAVMLQSLLTTLPPATTTPLSDQELRSKPLQFFFRLFPAYVARHAAELSDDDRCEIERSLQEYEQRTGVQP